MKRQAVLRTEPNRPGKKGGIITVQKAENILILNYWIDKKLKKRYCMNTETYEYQVYYAEEKRWYQRKLKTLVNENGSWWSSVHELEKNVRFNSEQEKELVNESLKKSGYGAWTKGFLLIDHCEGDYIADTRERKENNRQHRVQSIMDKVPDIPENFNKWIYDVAAGDKDYTFFNKESEKWQCTACGKQYMEKFLHRTDGEKKVRHNDMVICPRCKKNVQAKKRQQEVKLETRAMVLQDLDETQSVARHFTVMIRWGNGTRNIEVFEEVRLVLFRNHKKLACDIYWGQYAREYTSSGIQYFDNKSNPANRRIKTCYLYPEGIEQSLSGTEYEEWARLFVQCANTEQMLNYNCLMATRRESMMMNVVEYLLKGRFYRLLRETSESISLYWCEYCGTLNIRGKSIEEVFRLQDRQKINRIRDCNGGETILKWMRWSEETGRKISEETLGWLISENISMDDIKFIQDRMSPQQIINYVKKQQAAGYKGKTAKTILNQWEDYLSMCRRQNKNVSDEMVYRPRELKRRHEEMVEEIRKQQMIAEMNRNKEQRDAEAKRMRERFPGAEENLKEIRPRYEYQNENYMIIVPERLVDIMTEGQALHHCAGTTDRYFDRIMQHETYICFLRTVSEPEIPYYTIEVEPGGTIRQHRGYLDEEPEIEKIKPFLREWQKEIKKRMKEEDKERAKISAVKRQENIEELKAKNNTRVLNGLMEDFMEAV